MELGISENELLFILDANQVYQISMKLLANPKFAQMNESQHGILRLLMTKSMMLFLITALSQKVPRVSLLVAVSEMLLAVGITVPIILKSHLKLLKKRLAI